MNVEVGVIGGSGIYDIEDLEGVEEVRMSTPFGPPSDAYFVGTLAGRRVAFLSRHGRGHRAMPSEINYRANIYGMKLLGVGRILSASAVGSLKEEIAPLDIVLPDQFVDRTRQRRSTFFGDGLAAHISLADPFCPDLRRLLAARGRAQGLNVHEGGVYVCIEGPQFSTKAESKIYRSLGLDIIGMTNATEARLAREAEICYATIALVTDYDTWHEEEAPVSVEQVIGRLRTNAAAARALIRASIAGLGDERRCECGSALASAIITAPEAIDPATRERLRPLVGRYLEGRSA
jgi:5'-methylthioadenosine phosphorylase